MGMKFNKSEWDNKKIDSRLELCKSYGFNSLAELHTIDKYKMRYT